MLGHVLGLLVQAEQVVDVGVGASRRPASRWWRRAARGCRRSRCRRPGRTPASRAASQHVAGAAHVDVVERPRVGRPEAVEGGHVEDGPGTRPPPPRTAPASRRSTSTRSTSSPSRLAGSPPGSTRATTRAPRSSSSRTTDGADEAGRPGDQHPLARLDGTGRTCAVRGPASSAGRPTGGADRRSRRRVFRAMVVPDLEQQAGLRVGVGRARRRGRRRSASISASPMISGGRSLMMLTLSAATWVRIRWRWNSGTTISWENSPLRASSIIRKRARPCPRRRARTPGRSSDPCPGPRGGARTCSTSGARAFMKPLPVAPARSTMSSSSITWRVASPATMASWFLEKVDEWTTARSMRAVDGVEHPGRGEHAPRPGRSRPESALETVMMSGSDAPVLVAEEPAGAAQPGLDLVHDQQGAVPAAQGLDRRASSPRGPGRRPCPGWARPRRRPRRPGRSSPGQGVDVAEGDLVAPGQQRAEALAELLAAVEGEGPVGEPVEGVVAVEDAGRARWRPGRT